MKSGLLGAGLVVLAVLLPSSGSAQSPAPCDPGQTADAQVTTKDRVHGGKDKPLYETHEVLLSARVPGDASNVQLTPQPGVKILDPGSNGRKVDVVIPRPPSLSVTVSWEQKASSDPADTSRCSATRTFSFPVLRAKPPTVRLYGRNAARSYQVFTTFEVNPAHIGESLSPIEVTLRKSARAEVPSSHARALRFSVPMRPGDRKRYAKKIPAFTETLGPAAACRYWYLSCGAVVSRVGSMRFPDTLSPRQPSRWAAPSGIHVATSPNGRSFGYDVQVRQDGRLIARFQRAATGRVVPASGGGFFTKYRVTALKNFPR